ncbi:Na+ dependent nucleoside transporter C-terminus-domain-containing protein [Gaertneriomyces semiglobifer]|nr:Na+ dependent nucleoside transporter C-terminus-domain-containing protein [Gaertneriomyces semiglobifer]
MTQLVYEPLGWIWNVTFGQLRRLPRKILWGGVIVATLAAIIIVAAVSDSGSGSTRGQRLQSFLGVIVFLLIAVAVSRKHKAINLQTVAVGLLMQFLIALFVLRTDLGIDIFEWLAKFVTNFLEFSKAGLEFLFGSPIAGSFATAVFPAVVFFCSFIAVVYYWGGMQYIVAKMATAMVFVMDTSGAESIVAAASPFVGQGESALLVQPFVEYMTNSELHAIMTSGFATISGSVLLGYAKIINDISLLLTACVMSIPCSLLLSKLRYPEEEESLTKGRVRIPKQKEREANFLHAAGNGAATGAQLVILIAASILALVSLYTAGNNLVGWLFDMIDIHRHDVEVDNEGHADWITVSYILSYVFWPVAYVIGISSNDARLAAEIMAEKMVVNEFFAYDHLSKFGAVSVLLPAEVLPTHGTLSVRTTKLLAFALCGFANIGSIGIQVGCLGAMAPSRKSDLAKLAVSAMLVGTLSTWMTAAIAGTLM